MSFHHTLSALLRGRWLIDRHWAEANLPLVVNLLTGKMTDFITRTGNQQVERPFIVDPKTMVRYEWNDHGGPNMTAPDKSVAVIPISGPILKYNGECGEPGSIHRIGWVQEIDRRPNLAGAMYIIDSPGGQAEGTASLAAAIKKAAKRSVAYVDDGMAASAAMWIASAADEIYASMSTDMVGSVGVYARLLDFRGFLDQQGIKMHEIYAPQSTDKNKDYREAMEGNYELMEAELKILAQEFIDTVDANRSGRATASRKEWSTGKMFYAKDAVKMGLLDGIKPMQEALLRVLTVNRGNKLVTSSTKSSNKMAFEKTLATAKAQSFLVVEGGFLLSEDHLNNLETHIATQETALTTAQQEASTAAARVTELSTAATADQQKIKDLSAEVARLKKADAKEFTRGEGSGDDNFNDGQDKYADLRAAAFPGRF